MKPCGGKLAELLAFLCCISNQCQSKEVWDCFFLPLRQNGCEICWVFFLTHPVVTDVNSAAVANTSKTSHRHLIFIFLKCFCSWGQLVNLVETASGQLWYCSFVAQWDMQGHEKSGKYWQIASTGDLKMWCHFGVFWVGWVLLVWVFCCFFFSFHFPFWVF